MTVYLAYGPNGCGKSTFALSGSGRKWYAEFDPGSFARTGLDPANPDLELHKYPPPLTSLMDRGKLDVSMVGRSGRGGVGLSLKYSGWDEAFWAGFVSDYTSALTADQFDDYIWDTAKLMWEMNQNAYRERIQEETDLDTYRGLTRLDYKTPNMWMHRFIQAAKAKERNVVIVAHQADDYQNGEPTGKFKPDGWNEAKDQSDCTLRFVIRNKRPVGILEKGGAAGLDVIGLEVVEPTIEKMNGILAAAVVLRRNGIEIKGMDVEAIVATAGMMG